MPGSDDRCPVANADESGAIANPIETSEANRNRMNRVMVIGNRHSHNRTAIESPLCFTSPREVVALFPHAYSPGNVG